MMVSVDRYITVKYPRPVGKLQHRRHTVAAAAVGAWLLGILATCPILMVRRIPPRSGGRCMEIWTSAEWKGCYIFCRLMLVHIVPGENFIHKFRLKYKFKLKLILLLS